MKKYTKEQLEPLVRQSLSVAEVLRKLGKNRLDGGTATYLSKIIKRFDIDTAHFLGSRANCGKNHKGGPKKKSWQELLVLSKGDRRIPALTNRPIQQLPNNYVYQIMR